MVRSTMYIIHILGDFLVINFKQSSYFLLISACFFAQAGFCDENKSRTFKFEINPVIAASPDGNRKSSTMLADEAQLKMTGQTASKELPPRERNPEITEDDLVVVGYDSNNLEISRAIITDPRLIRYESFDETSGEFIEAEMMQRKADFNVTLPANDNLFSIEILKPHWNGEKYILESQGVSYVNPQ